MKTAVSPSTASPFLQLSSMTYSFMAPTIVSVLPRCSVGVRSRSNDDSGDTNPTVGPVVRFSSRSAAGGSRRRAGSGGSAGQMGGSSGAGSAAGGTAAARRARWGLERGAVSSSS